MNFMKPTPNSDIRILVVDDNPEIVRSAQHLLKQAGYTTATASNGVEAMQVIQTFSPELALVDRDMPEMDGMELCRRIKSDPSLENIFVIIVSAAFTRTEEQSEGLEMGADSYIARPIANRELLARVDAYVRILRLYRQLRDKNTELEAALEKVKMLSGMLPICSSCKKIRDDTGYWSQVESYVQKHSEATFTHGLCPDCAKKYFPGM
jgi:DNA-binding response OmpR family regulator